MIKVIVGQKYMLDGKVTVKVVRSFNRSLAMHLIKIDGGDLELVERERLSECAK